MPQFIDTARITVKAGRGGDGAVAFHREKYVPAGGPDGGDGGNGGNIVLKTDSNLSTLMDFRYKRKYTAEPGQNGSGKKCSGKAGSDLIIRVPYGTVIRDAETGRLIKDMSDDRPFVLAKGGTGGWGNQHFATPTRQAPRFAKPGMPGQELTVLLELKLLADVGLVGFPNVGKSTLLSVISAARPKIADYHFTTLVPNLGIVRVDEGSSFVVADIPGMIEGAAQGAGLGHDFLRHVDRCRLLVHLVDGAGSEGRDPVEDFKIINKELQEYSPELARRPQILVCNKSDLLSEDMASPLRKLAEEENLPYFEISAATRQGIEPLIYCIHQMLQELPAIRIYEPEYQEDSLAVHLSDLDATITVREEDGVYFVEGPWLEQLLRGINFSDYDSRMYFDRMMRSNGIYDQMESLGISEGDTIDLYGIEFEYVK